MSIKDILFDNKITLIKDFLGVRIPQWYNTLTGLFVEVSNENPLPVNLSDITTDSLLATIDVGHLRVHQGRKY